MLVSMERGRVSLLVGPLGLAVTAMRSLSWLPTVGTFERVDATYGFRCRTWTLHWLGVHTVFSWVTRLGETNG